MIFNYSKSKLLVLIIISLFITSCTAPVKEDENQISNEAQEDSLINFSELKLLFKEKHYDEAYSLLENMKSTLPYSRYTKHGKILEIHSYYEQKKYDTAIAKANKFIKSHPAHTKMDYVLYLRAISSHSLNRPLYKNLSQIPKIIEVNRSKVRQTFSYFAEVVQKYPESIYVKESINNIKKLRQVLSEYELNDAYILFDLAKYEEVIKNCLYLVKNYPNSTIMTHTLKLQAKSHRLLGQVDKARSIEINIERDFSNKLNTKSM